jgi:hypothetical protein
MKKEDLLWVLAGALLGLLYAAAINLWVAWESGVYLLWLASFPLGELTFFLIERTIPVDGRSYHMEIGVVVNWAVLAWIIVVFARWKGRFSSSSGNGG